MKERPVLETDRLILRPFTLVDAGDVQRLAGERDIASTTLNIPAALMQGARDTVRLHCEFRSVRLVSALNALSNAA